MNKMHTITLASRVGVLSSNDCEAQKDPQLGNGFSHVTLQLYLRCNKKILIMLNYIENKAIHVLKRFLTNNFVFLVQELKQKLTKKAVLWG